MGINEEKKANKSKQLREERIHYAVVFKEFCLVEIVRVGKIPDDQGLSKSVIQIIEDGMKSAYNSLYPQLVASKVKVSFPKNKQFHNRLGAVLAWDESKKKYKIGLDTKKKKKKKRAWDQKKKKKKKKKK